LWVSLIVVVDDVIVAYIFYYCLGLASWLKEHHRGSPLDQLMWYRTTVREVTSRLTTDPNTPELLGMITRKQIAFNILLLSTTDV